MYLLYIKKLMNIILYLNLMKIIENYYTYKIYLKKEFLLLLNLKIFL